MKYKVFTDGSSYTEKNMIGVSYVILTETDFIVSDSTSISGFANPAYAETIAIGFAARYLNTEMNLTKDDTVIFYTDCVNAIKHVSKYGLCTTNKYYVNKNKNVEAAIKSIKVLTKNTNVSIQKVHGHKVSLNPNSYVNRLCRITIKE